MRYEIDTDTYEVLLFVDNMEEPFIRQPHYPNGDTFDSYSEAKTWAEAAIEAYSPLSIREMPNGKNKAGELKPTVQEVKAFINNRIAKDPTLIEFADQYLDIN
jgi:hypothetical protein